MVLSSQLIEGGKARRDIDSAAGWARLQRRLATQDFNNPVKAQ